MALQFPIPEELNQTWGGARNWLTDMLGNIFDPNRQTYPPAFQGMQAPPQSLPELMASMAIVGTPKDAYESGILGMGPMPLLVRPPWPVPKPEWAESALKTFGRTYDPHEAGYILRDGKMLDFSGKNQGAGPSARGQRYLDHRDIWQVGENLGTNDVDMVGFMDKAQAIRTSLMKDSDLMIDLVNPPSNQQLNVLRDWFSYKPSAAYVDITDPTGRTVKSIEIEKPTFPKFKKFLEDHFGK